MQKLRESSRNTRNHNKKNTDKNKFTLLQKCGQEQIKNSIVHFFIKNAQEKQKIKFQTINKALQSDQNKSEKMLSIEIARKTMNVQLNRINKTIIARVV